MSVELITDIFQKFGKLLYSALVVDDRYLLILEGLKNTILISIFAVMIGIAIGVIIAVSKFTAQGKKSLRWLEWLCNLYLTAIRGTPVMIQLMIMWNVIFAFKGANAIIAGILTFGINSGAYVAEIIRAGIASIDKGQFEAGRSLGLNGSQTMRLIILPQAVKNILPALGNEFITLVKETSVAGFITVTDLSRAASLIGSRTYQYAVPLLLVALIYLTIVLGLTKLITIMERRLAKSDNR